MNARERAEIEYGLRWAALCRREGHVRGLPGESPSVIEARQERQWKEMEGQSE